MLPSFSNQLVHLDTVSCQIFGDIQETQFSGSKADVHVHLKNAFPGGIGNRRITFGYNLLVCLPPLILMTTHTISQPCSPTLGQVDWFSWTETCPLSQPVPPNLKTPLSQSHPVPPKIENPLSLSHSSHVLQPVPTCLVVPLALSSLHIFNSPYFFWVSRCHSIFRKTLSIEKLQSTIMLERVNNKQISTKRPETTVIIHSNTWVYFV